MSNDEECTRKDEELAALRREQQALEFGAEAPLHSSGLESSGRGSSSATGTSTPRSPEDESRREPTKATQRGKAPPVDAFTAEDHDVRLEDWLPTLERAATWNGWSDEERLMQLAGHLRGRASQEWNLIVAGDKSTYANALEALRARLDPVNRVVLEMKMEGVEDFVRRLERLFQVAYGRDGLNTDARETLLYGQLHDGLKYELIKSSTVSGAQNYKQLCLCAKAEGKRLAGLKKRQLYRRESQKKPVERERQLSDTSSKAAEPGNRKSSRFTRERRCYNCNAPGHLAKDCKQPKKESSAGSDKGAKAKMVTSVENPRDLLLSSESEEEEVHQVRVKDEGSRPRVASVNIQGVQALGIIDSAVDITIMNGALFKEVVSTARLRKKAFRDADKVPYAYDGRSFQLHGCIECNSIPTTVQHYFECLLILSSIILNVY